MKAYRTAYISILIIMGVGAFIFNSSVFLIISVVMVLFYIITFVGLFLGARKAKFIPSIRERNVLGEDIGLVINIIESKKLIINGALIVKVSVENILFKEYREELYHIAIPKNSVSVRLPFKSDFFGAYRIKIEELGICDSLGLFVINKEIKDEMRMVVYPKPVAMYISSIKLSHSDIIGENYDNTKKGDDVTEFFDFREYARGDSLYAIYWKLSAKLDKLIVRENSSPANNNTLVYIDFGINTAYMKPTKENLSMVMSTGLSISNEFINMGIQHTLFVPAKKQIHRFNISDYNAMVMANDSIMSISPADECGVWLKQMLIAREIHNYTKFICVVWENYPEEIEQLSAFTDLTIVILHSENNKMQSVENKRLHIVSINEKDLYNKPHTLIV